MLLSPLAAFIARFYEDDVMLNADERELIVNKQIHADHQYKLL